MANGLKYPTWELAKEIADKLPGGDKGESKDDQCPECGADLDKDPLSKKDQKGR